MLRVLRDIRSFVSSKDLVVFAVMLALSNQLQTTLNTLIDALIMPFVSHVTGRARLSTREARVPGTGITVRWGAAAYALITFAISLVVMVEIVRLIVTRARLTSSVTFA